MFSSFFAQPGLQTYIINYANATVTSPCVKRQIQYLKTISVQTNQRLKTKRQLLLKCCHINFIIILWQNIATYSFATTVFISDTKLKLLYGKLINQKQSIIQWTMISTWISFAIKTVIAITVKSYKRKWSAFNKSGSIVKHSDPDVCVCLYLPSWSLSKLAWHFEHRWTWSQEA